MAQPCSGFMAKWEPRIRFPEIDEPPAGEATGRAAFQAAYDPTRDSIWLEVPDDDWTVAHRLMVQDGQLVLAELRIFPTDFPGSYSTNPGQWSEDGLVPPGGIRASLLRTIKVGEHMKVAEKIFNGIRLRMGDEAYERLFGPMGIPAEASLRVGRSQRHKEEDSQVRQVRLSNEYVKKVRAGSKKPVAEIAAEEYLGRDAIRDILHDARRNGYLTPPTRKGIAGGTITPKGLEVLRSAGLPPPETDNEEEGTK